MESKAGQVPTQSDCDTFYVHFQAYAKNNGEICKQPEGSNIAWIGPERGDHWITLWGKGGFQLGLEGRVPFI